MTFLKRSQKVPLRTTLVVPFVLQIVAAVGLVGYLSFRSGQEAVNDLANQLIDSAGQRMNEHLDTYLALPQQINQRNAAEIAAGTLDLQNSSALQNYFWRQAKVFESLSYIGYARTDGSEVGAGRWIDGANLLVFDSPLEGSSVDYLADEQGNPAQVVQRYDYDPRKQVWYEPTVAAGEPIWGGVVTGIASNLELTDVGESLQQADANSTLGVDSFYMIAAARHPVYGADGQLAGILVADLVLTQISQFLNQLQVSPNGQAFIIERDGQLVASSGAVPVVDVVDGQTVRFNAETSPDPYLRAVLSATEDAYGSFPSIQQEQLLTFAFDGKRHFAQVRPWQDDFGLDWLVLVTVPESDFMAEINRNRRNTMLLCLGALLLAILVGISTARWVARPLNRLTTASKAVAGGQLDQRVAETSRISELKTLSHSFNSMADQLQESFETLEDKVEARTAELATANEQITALNAKLKAENLRMGAELDVARQIQQMILPKAEELENVVGLDIAGFMEPADEVGGDYYDVLETNGVVTIGIGDVTGHGLESGLLMLMTQTAVRTLKEVQEHDPVQFLDALNRTIYRNVQRMNSDRNLTLAILNYAAGRVSISGQHEETLVVRADGTIERIDTMDLGLPIGLDDDIADFIDHATIVLQPGDGVVLYTDGIPEAYNPKKEQYELERLCEVLSANWQQSAEVVKDAVIADVRHFIGTQKVFDDITLLVLKQEDISTSATEASSQSRLVAQL